MLVKLKDWLLVLLIMLTAKGSALNAGDRVRPDSLDFPADNLLSWQAYTHQLPVLAWLVLIGVLGFLALQRNQNR